MECVEIPTHLMKEINLWMKSQDQSSSLEQLTRMFNINGVPTSDFICMNSSASVLTSTSHTTSGNASLRLVTTAVITRELDSKRDKRSPIMMRRCKLSPSHSVFNEDGFNDDPDYLSETLENDISQAILYRATCQQINCLRILIQEIESVSPTMEADASASPETPNGTPRQTVEAPPPPILQLIVAWQSMAVGWCRDRKDHRVLCYRCHKRT